MYTIGRDNIDGYDFKSEENLKKWRGFFIPTLQQIQKLTHPALIAKQDGLQYVESLILKLLGAIISTTGSVGSGGSSMMTMHTTSDVEDRIRRLIPDPLKTNSIQKAKEILSALRHSKKSKANSLFHGNDRSPLKTPVDKFHHLLQKDVLCYKTDVQVSQYLLAVLEFIATDILQLAGHYVRNMIHTEITSQDIRVAMCADKFLMEIFYKDEDEVDGPPLSANCYYHQSFFDSDFCDGEYGNIGNHTITYSEAVYEFIQEERQFIRELSLIIKVFRDPLISVLSEDDLQKIFVNIDDIYEFSIKFLGLLEDAVEVADEDDCPAIGSCFIEIAEDEEMDVFHKYAQNVMNFSFRDHLYYILSQHSLQSQITEIFSSRYNSGAMLAALQYVLPRLLLLPIYHCFSYFKAIEKLKELTPLPNDRENYEQADSTLQSLRNVLEKQKKLNKFGDGYFLRLYGRTHRATALAKMKEIQTSIDNWNGKDIWQSCNEFIREGVLYKVSNPGKSIGHHLSNRVSFPTERRAFLFDSLLVLCKPCNKRIVPGRGDNSQLEWRCKERFFIRNIEIIERDDPYVRSNFSLLSSHFGGHSSSSMDQSSSSSSSYNQTNSSVLDQSLSSLSSSVSNISSSHLTANLTNNSDSTNTIHAFEISQTNQNQSIVLMAKTAEEKDSWMSQLILLNMRSMLERTLDAKLSEEAKKHPLLLPHPSMYRFATEDMESNIIFEENKSNRNVPLIKGATLLKLVERLTYHKYGDPVLVRIFLTTYRSFCTPSELLKLLIERFEIPEPDFRSCMQAMHYANDELSSPTSMGPPSQELLSNNLDSNNNNNNENHHVLYGSDSSSAGASGSTTGPTSPTLPSLSPVNNNQLPTTPSDLNIFFDEQDEQCQQDYREMLKRFRKEYAQPVQFRVLNVLRHWIDKHWYDFERDCQLLDMLNEFLNEKLAKSHSKVAKWCHHIRNVIDRSKKLQKTADSSATDTQSHMNLPIERLLSSNHHFINNGGEEFDLLTFSPGAIATNLTLFEFELYRAVQPYELIGMDDQSLVWTKKDKQKTSPNLLKMIRHYSIMCYYFEKCIVEAENFEERVAIVTRIVEIMIHLMEFNNFNGVFEIVGALGSAPIHRLEHTRTHLERSNSKLKKAIEEAKDLTEDHFKKYKEKLFSINPPCVPFLGNFLTNIVHLEEGNPEYLSPPNAEGNVSMYESQSQQQNSNSQNTSSSMLLDDGVASSKLINFQKKRRVAETISMIQQYQNEPYNFKNLNSTIWNFFENLDTIVFPDMEEKQFNDYLYNKSLEIEPRGCKQPPKFPRRWPDRNLKQPSKSRNIRLPGIPGISHQSQSSIGSSYNGGNHSHQNSNSHMMDNSDTIFQQQSPSTPLTPPAAYCQDAIFAPVMIGGSATAITTNNGTPHISPTTPSLQSSISFFQFSTNQQLPQAPPPTPPQQQSSNAHHHHHHHSSSSPLISPPLSSEFSTGNLVCLMSKPPPLLPRKTSNSISAPPPLPPKTYKLRDGCLSNSPPVGTPGTTSTTIPSGKISYRDKGPPPLPRMPPPISPHSSHYHQRVNSDITTSSSTSPSASSTCGGLAIVRRNSAMENSATLPPRRYSGTTVPLPLTTSPNTPMMNTQQTLFNLLPGCSPGQQQPQPSSPQSSQQPQPPPLPPVSLSQSLHRQPPTPTLATSSTSNPSNVPELPPKTYRLSNVCR